MTISERVVWGKEMAQSTISFPITTTKPLIIPTESRPEYSGSGQRGISFKELRLSLVTQKNY